MRLGVCVVLLIVVVPCHEIGADYFVTDIVDAAKRGDGHAVHRLLEQNAKLSKATDADGYTALHWAGIRGHWRIFAELVSAGAPVNAVGGDGGTPLHWTCHHDRADMVELLLEAGADVSTQNRWGRTPLHVAARRGCLDVAALLLAHGADPDEITREGWTALHVASRSGHVEMVDLLLEGGADPDRTDRDGLRPSDGVRLRPREFDIGSAGLDDFCGIYDLGSGFTVKVWRVGDGLRIREFAPDDLYPIAPDVFFCRQEPWRVTFLRDDAGQVASIQVEFLRRTVRGEKTTQPRYVGSRVCQQCHQGAEQGHQYVEWLRSRHSHAFWRLGADWALYLAALRPQFGDLVNPQGDRRCLLCHVTGAQDPDNLFVATYRREEGVTCEACHGPGSEYIKPEIMSDRERFLGNGGVIPDERVCRSCHRNGERFDFADWWPKIAHPRATTQSSAAH